jgi:hypothetical protein
MSNLEEFKSFVKENPSLLKYVRNNEMTWQKFYEMYDLYGKDNEIWNSYLTKEKEVISASSFDLLNWIKNIDMDSLQENINSVKRVISVLQDLGNNNTESNSYEPRPLYKHFED